MNPKVKKKFTLKDFQHNEAKDEFKTAARHLGNSEDVLDVGCGEGGFRTHISGRYFGLESNPQAVENARTNGVDILGSNLDDLTEEGKIEFGAVTMFQVIEHVENPADNIEKCLALLRRRGVLVLCQKCDNQIT